MSAYCLIRPGANRVMPWKNGGGATAEIAIDPPGSSIATGFDWRLSIATVATDGPFSAFPQHHRVIMLLEGGGMTLDFSDGERAVLDRPFQPLEFAGHRAAHCRLIDGPSADLNLMVAHDRFVARVAVASVAPWTPDDARDHTRLLFVLAGEAECQDPNAVHVGAPIRLALRDTLLIRPGDAAPTVVPGHGFLAFSAAIGLRA